MKKHKPNELEKALSLYQVLVDMKRNNMVITADTKNRCKALFEKVLTVLEKVI